MKISEVFGYGIENHSQEAWRARNKKTCPFKDSPCTKVSKIDPLGICTFSDDQKTAVVCPSRFLERNRIFKDAGRLAFGTGAHVVAFPEVRILKIEGTDGSRDRKIGKVDFIIAKIEDSNIVDFAALEVQAVYISGTTIRPNFDTYIETQGPSNSFIPEVRRPDFRSSAQKRLVPQLQLKVPVFRRWGKKFFVVVDSQFFQALPSFPRTTESNSEITWLSYSFEKSQLDYEMKDPEIIYSNWDDVSNALREGTPPEPGEIIKELQTKFSGKENKYNIYAT